MKNKPELVKISATQYKCSLGDWRWELNLDKLPRPTPAESQRLAEQRFADHVKQVHSREDVNQAAARVVREATKD